MHDPSVSMRYRSSHYFASVLNRAYKKINYGCFGQPSHRPVYQASICLQMSQPLSKIKCTKAGHENPQKPAGGKRRERAPPTKAMVPPSGF